MRVTRIYTSQALKEGALIRLAADAGHHVRRVLRLKAGAALVVFNGDGRDFHATVASLEQPEVWLQVASATETEPPPKLNLTLFQGIGKSERMDLALQKAVELGVESLVPLFCERTVVRLSGPRLGRRMEHWRRVVIAACEQSGRSRVPELAPHLQLERLCKNPPPGLKLVLRPGGASTLSQLAPQRRISILTGPEGGLSAAELAAVEAAGFLSVRLGPRVLRTETAPLAAISALQALWGDFRD